MAKYSVTKYIQKLARKENLVNRAKKVIGLELSGSIKKNISKGLITPKTIKKKGKTLYDIGVGIKNIGYNIEGNKIKFGNYIEYMGAHIKGVDKTLTSKKGKSYKLVIPKRNWLFFSVEGKKIIRAWIIDLFK